MADSLIGTNVITYKRTADILQQSTEETSSSVQRLILFSSVAWIQNSLSHRQTGYSTLISNITFQKLKHLKTDVFTTTQCHFRYPDCE